MKNLVIHHSADFDGLFCREIAKRSLPDETDFIGWDFPHPPLSPGILQQYETVHVMDLPLDAPFGMKIKDGWFCQGNEQVIPVDRVKLDNVIWIDHHASAIMSLRTLNPDEGPRDLFFDGTGDSDRAVCDIVELGQKILAYASKTNAAAMSRSFVKEWEGLKFLCLNTASCNSLTFRSKDIPETGHDALLGFYFDGSYWNYSLYHAAHRKDLDLSQIAVKYGGGGHCGACGFRSKTLIIK